MVPIRFNRNRLVFIMMIAVVAFVIVIRLNAAQKQRNTTTSTAPGTQGNSMKQIETAPYFAAIDGPSHPNCWHFRKVFPYIRESRHGDMDVAFTIVVHKDPRQIARLLRMIHRPNNYYCIHLDKRSSEEFEQALEGIARCFGSNVELVPVNERVALQWGDESVLRPQLLCGAQALRRHSTWKYLLNMVGQEFPLKTHLEMVAALEALNGSNLVEAFDIRRFQGWVHGKSLPLQASCFS